MHTKGETVIPQTNESFKICSKLFPSHLTQLFYFRLLTKLILLQLKRLPINMIWTF